MLKVEMDVVVKEYVMRMMSSIVLGPERLVELPDRVSDRMRKLFSCPFWQARCSRAQRTTHTMRKGMLTSLSVLIALVRNWSWLFPGATLTANRSETCLYEIKGSRARYIREGWLAADNMPVPPWPN
jgi:hypothetical protein